MLRSYSNYIQQHYIHHTPCMNMHGFTLVYKYIGPKASPGFPGKAPCGSGTGALHGKTGPCVLPKFMLFLDIAFLA